jgi:DNA-directed RNA polymerase subunit RPC12/RpoP
MTNKNNYKPPICVWCSKPWTDEMVEIETEVSNSCPTCGYGQEVTGKMTITCDNCNKIVYIKEF